MGLMFLAALALYIGVSIAICVWIARWAKRTGRTSWKWGWGAALVMYLLVFWDHIPTVVAHGLLCKSVPEAKIYKTWEQWKLEHPIDQPPTPVAKGNTVRLDSEGREVLMANSRFGLRRVTTSIGPLPVRISKLQEVDMVTESVLLETTFLERTSHPFKPWLHNESCIVMSPQVATESEKFHSAHTVNQ